MPMIVVMIVVAVIVWLALIVVEKFSEATRAVAHLERDPQFTPILFSIGHG
jgi:hypothetical protein